MRTPCDQFRGLLTLLPITWALTLKKSAQPLQSQAAEVPELVHCQGFDCVTKWMQMRDPVYAWIDTGVRVYGVDPGTNVGWTGFVLNMTSEQWLEPQDTNRPIWWHSVVVVLPSTPRQSDYATVVVGGSSDSGAEFVVASNGLGSAQNAYESNPDVLVGANFAAVTGVPSVVILTVPDQPLTFTEDPSKAPREEDALKAYAWDRFMNNTKQPEWAPELGMHKAVIKGIDTGLDFLSTELKMKVTKLGITGCSKRAWSSLMAAAYDPRIKFLVACVMSLHVDEQERMQLRAYGNPPLAMQPYFQAQTFGHQGTPEFQTLLSIVDPIWWIEKLTLPKLWLSAGRDDFFLPDHTRIWWPSLPSPKQIAHDPKSVHVGSLWLSTRFSTSAAAFMRDQIWGVLSPSIDWEIKEDGAISAWIHTDTRPSAVYLWSAHTCGGKRRDFREITGDRGFACSLCGVASSTICMLTANAWSNHTLSSNADGRWTASIPAPAVGWTAFFIEFHFPPPSWSTTTGDTVRATEVSVVPDTWPYPLCHGKGCVGTALV